MNFRPALHLLAFSTASLLTPLAEAHDMVLVPEPHQLRVRYGHPHDWRSVDRARLIELRLLRGDAAATDAYAALAQQGLDLVASAAKLGDLKGAWIAAARYDNGLWAELQQPSADAKPQWRNASRFMVPNPKSTALYLKYAKAYAGSADDPTTFRRLAGHMLELVPQKNPLAVKAGETLPVLVLFNGQPLVGAGIEVSNLVDAIAEDRITRYPTNADGIAQVVLRSKGIHMLGVDIERPNDGSLGEAVKALPVDKVGMIATYTVVR